MSADDADRKTPRYRFDRHAPEYRHQFEAITQEMRGTCPVAWSDTHGGHWVAPGHSAVFELARSAEYLSNDHDVNHGIINGIKHLPATFSPGPRVGAGLDETLAALQRVTDSQGLAEPVTARKATARVHQ